MNDTFLSFRQHPPLPTLNNPSMVTLLMLSFQLQGKGYLLSDYYKLS